MATEYKVFLSYARANERITGNISKLKLLLEEQLNEVMGVPISIFKDDEALEIGAQWKDEISRTISEDAILMIALITPSFFQSEHCRDEIQSFLEREKRLGRNDLILPLYLLDVDEISDESKRKKDDWLANMLLQRNLLDFKELYAKNFPRVKSRDEVNKLCIKIKRVFDVFDAISSKRDKPDEPPNLPPISQSDVNQSEYAKREHHFVKEKEFLADRFGEYLWARLNHINRPTILLIDSGTTLRCFFQTLGRLAVEASRRKNSWIENLIVLTNNLAGVKWLLENGKESESRWAEIALQCIMMPGTPLPAYNAATSLPKTSAFYEHLKLLQPHLILEQLKNACDCRVIALVTGNWIRIRNSFPRYPIPLARGRGHLEIKQSMINLADEVYVIATLGKIFADVNKTDVQAILFDFVHDQSDGGDVYQEVKFEAEPITQVSDEDAAKQTNKIRLVTTSRRDGRILSGLSKLLENVGFLDTLNVTEENFEEFKRPFFLSEFNDVSNLMFSFDDGEDDLAKQILTEFPHKESRKEEFLRCFHLTDDAIAAFSKM